MAKRRLPILIADALLGVGAFAGLFHSSFGPAQQVFFGCSFLLIMLMMELYSLQTDMIGQNQFEGLYESLKALESKIDGNESAPSIEVALNGCLKRIEIEYLVNGSGFPQLFLLAGRVCFWVIGGYLAHTILPASI